MIEQVLHNKSALVHNGEQEHTCELERTYEPGHMCEREHNCEQGHKQQQLVHKRVRSEHKLALSS